MDITDFLPDGFNLREGAGGGDPRSGLCFMETVALIAGEPITDYPACACPVLTRYGIGLNDRLDKDDRQRLLPLAWACAGTRSEAHERARIEILGRAACDMALMVLPLYRAKHPTDDRVRKAIEAAISYWDNPNAAAAANAANAAARAAAAAFAAAADADDKALSARIIDRAIEAFREAIKAGPNGGLPDEVVRERINAVRELLPVRA